MSEHSGLLGAITEAMELQQQFGCSADEAFDLQRRQAAERLEIILALNEKAEIIEACNANNIIPFQVRH